MRQFSFRAFRLHESVCCTEGCGQESWHISVFAHPPTPHLPLLVPFNPPPFFCFRAFSSTFFLWRNPRSTHVHTHTHQPKLDADPEIQTSLRWLTTSPSNAMHKIVLFLMRKVRMFKADETFDPKTFKTKMIFMGSQLVFTIVVSLPTPFLYNSKRASFSLAFFVFLCALWNRYTVRTNCYVFARQMVGGDEVCLFLCCSRRMVHYLPMLPGVL